jgi:RNA polymerase sigma factor (sigma-70 family)
MPQERPSSALDNDLSLSFRERREQIRIIAARGAREDAADVVQESFLKAIEADRKTLIEKPLHFLRRIARNAVIDRLRARQRSEVVFSSAPAPDTSDLGASPERALIASERLARAMTIIERMPPRRKAVFILHRIDELTLGQCAKRLGISVKTVEKHMSEAMVQLSREIEIE